MKNFITVEEAKKLVSNSKERQEELIEKVNNSIKYQATLGLRWDHLPMDLSQIEEDWIKKNLTDNGFTIKSGNPVINW